MKLVDNVKLQKLVEGLNDKLVDSINDEMSRAKSAENTLNTKVTNVQNMFGGKSLQYVTQAQYDALSPEQKNDSTIVWHITDAPEVEDVVLEMIGNKTIVYLTEVEYNALTEVEKNDETKAYFITDSNDAAEIKDMLNGYSIWVGSSEEYNALTAYDDKTLYFEVGNDTINKLSVNEGSNRLQLSKDKYQEVKISTNVNIVFPNVNTITELHVYITGTSNKTFTLPSCKKLDGNATTYTISGTSEVYEVIAVFNMTTWLVEVKKFV